MRHTFLLTLVGAASLSCAQAQMPGTFSQAASLGQIPGYVLSPPSMSFGNGLTPNVVTTNDSFAIAAPQSISLNSAEISAMNNNAPFGPTEGVDSGTPMGTPARGGSLGGSQGQARSGTLQRPYMDFFRGTGVESPHGSMSDASIVLGDVARQIRKDRPNQFSGRSLTNADIEHFAASSSGTADTAGASGLPVWQHSNAAQPAESQPTEAQSGKSGSDGTMANKDGHSGKGATHRGAKSGQRPEHAPPSAPMSGGSSARPNRSNDYAPPSEPMGGKNKNKPEAQRTSPPGDSENGKAETARP